MAGGREPDDEIACRGLRLLALWRGRRGGRWQGSRGSLTARIAIPAICAVLSSRSAWFVDSTRIIVFGER